MLFYILKNDTGTILDMLMQFRYVGNYLLGLITHTISLINTGYNSRLKNHDTFFTTSCDKGKQNTINKILCAE